MGQKLRNRKNAVSAVLAGVALSVALSVGICMFAAILIGKEVLGEGTLNAITMLTLAISSFLGTAISMHMTDATKLYTYLWTTGVFLLWLSCVGFVCCGFHLRGFWVTALIIFGCGISAMLSVKPKGRSYSGYHVNRKLFSKNK